MDRVDYQSMIVQDLINLERAKELDISPWYQRRSVWNNPQKAYLINTIFEQKPIPAIYIRHSIDLERSKSVREIVDGQQRTRTILSFYSNEFASRHPAYPKKVKFSQLKREDQQRFLLTSIPVGYLLGATDSDVIDIFGRINSVSKSLNDQEKRNAEFSGDMKQFCLHESSTRMPFWRSYDIFSGTEISRMNEVQFVSDIVLSLLNGLSDFSPTALKKLYKDFDEDFPKSSETAARISRVFDILASIDPRLIRETIFKRQPVFFSLFLVVDETQSIANERLEIAIKKIDERFNSESNVNEDDLAFRDACTSTTQRIAQRRVRHGYIKAFV